MKRKRKNKKIWKRICLQVILLAGVGSMLPAHIGLAAEGACSHNYVIQQAEQPGSGVTDKICVECGDKQQITLPTKLSAFTWSRDNISAGTLEDWVLEVSDVINLKVQTSPNNADIIVPVITDEMVNGGSAAPKDFAGLDVEYHTQEQIRDYYKKYPNNNLVTKYSVAPSLTAPYTIGKLSEENKQDALNLLNLLRYVTGVPTVSISDDAQNAAQAAATVFAINNSFNHFIAKRPAGMSDEMIELAQEGAMNSNLVGYRARLGDTLMAYIEDQGNYKDFGHRMQLLKPHMKETGFGIATSRQGIPYSATYVDAWWSLDTALSYPAQNQPVEYFGKDYGWTVVIPGTVHTSKLNIKLTDVKTGKIWNFKKSSENLTIYMTANTVLIFFPEDLEYKEGDKYKVEITGIENPISYEVNMFRLTAGESIERAEVTFLPALQKSYTYVGRELKPHIRFIRLGTYTLTEGTDYTVSYENNKNAGTARIKIAGKGFYHGTIVKTFGINARIVTKDGIRYKISDDTGAVCLGLEANTKMNGSLNIPDTITFNRREYKVKSISAKAFQKSKISAVSIGKNVQSIGKSAFMNCKRLKSIEIKSKKLKSVGKKAFKGIKAKAKIKVPAKKFKAYKKLLKGKGQGKKVKIVKG